MDDSGYLIAWIALGISAATFGWKAWETYVRWPRIGVVLRQHVTIRVGGIPTAEAFGTPRMTRQGDNAPEQNEPSPEPPSPDPEPPPPPRTGPEEKFALIVVNNGAEATSVANVGIRSEDRSRNISVQHRRDEGHEIIGPDLPARVEAHGALEWTIGYDLAKDFPRGTKVIGYAYRYRSFRKYPKSRRNPLKLYETAIAYTKN